MTNRTTRALPLLVASLDKFGRDDLAIAGGKGANLGELRRAGFPVPPGFVVTTAAYDRFVATSDLASEIRQALAGIEPSDNAALERASETIRQAFAAAAVPSDVAGVIMAAYRSLGSAPAATVLVEHSESVAPPPISSTALVAAAGPTDRAAAPAVAVRSSATAEDLPGASFAGQQETYLNVSGEDALLDAVHRCWASLWSPRSIAYRQRQGIDHSSVKLAVVVQQLIDAEVAGVLFTVNPITGARDELVIDASPGLGEAVVSGLVTPDHYVLKKGTYAAVARRLGQREIIIRPAVRGGTEQTPGDASAAEAQPVLSDPTLRELAALGEQVEQHFGAPQDVEWAWAGGRCYVLQARPVTALPQAPDRVPSAAAGQDSVAAPSPLVTTPDRAGAPGAPKGWASALRRPMAERAARRGPNLAGELFPFRPYPLDVGVHLGPMLRAVGNAMAGPLGLRFPLAEDVVEIEDGVPVRLTEFQPRLTWRVLYKPWITLWQRRRYDLLRWAEDPALDRAQRRAREIEARDLTALPWLGVVASLHDAIALGPAIGVLRDRYFPLAIWATIRLWLLLRLAGRQRQLATLLSGVETKTQEMNRHLERLAERVRTEPALRDLFARTASADLPAALAAAADERPEAQALWAAFQEFQRVYGHRETAITIFSQPSWREAPEIPLGAIKALAAAPFAPEQSGTEDGQPVAWEQARDEVLAHSIAGEGPLRRAFLTLLAQAREFPRLREDTHFYFCLPLPLERRAALELARRLVAAGALAAPEDVFHLTLDDLEAAGRPWPPPSRTVERLRALVARRKARREALAGQPFVDPSLTQSPDAPPEALLAGAPGSAGVAEGPVRVIRSPAEFANLQRGEVLVAPFTNPTWTPLFPLAAAVVVDTGGAMSHAAIVAREYGVPAVMGTRDATARLADGQRVRVDGTRGLVFASGQ